MKRIEKIQTGLSNHLIDFKPKAMEPKAQQPRAKKSDPAAFLCPHPKESLSDSGLSVHTQNHIYYCMTCGVFRLWDPDDNREVRNHRTWFTDDVF